MRAAETDRTVREVVLDAVERDVAGEAQVGRVMHEVQQEGSKTTSEGERAQPDASASKEAAFYASTGCSGFRQDHASD